MKNKSAGLIFAHEKEYFAAFVTGNIQGIIGDLDKVGL